MLPMWVLLATAGLVGAGSPWCGGQSTSGGQPTLVIGTLGGAGDFSAYAAAIAVGVISGRLRYPAGVCALPGDPGAAAGMVANGTVHAVLGAWAGDASGAAPWASVPGVQDVGALGPLGGYVWLIPRPLGVATPACLGWPGFAAGAPCAAAVNHSLLVGPAAPLWGFGGPAAVCGGGPGGVGAANVSAACRVFGSTAGLVGAAAALCDNGTAFLGLLPTPSYVTATRNLSEVVFPAAATPPRAALRKVVWAEVFAFFPPSVTAVLRSMRFADTDVSAVYARAGGNATSAAAWLLTPAGSAAAGAWVRVLEVTSIAPRVGPTSGGTLLSLGGQGFGTSRPLAVSVSIGGRPCGNVTWVSDVLLTCVTPPGSGAANPITLGVGFQAAFVVPAYGYLPATLFAVRDAHGAPALTVVAGDTLYVIGSNFINVVTMQCLFGTIVVPAVFVNGSAVSCLAPAVASGVVDVFVSNDGVRWSNGWQFGLAAYAPVQMGTDLSVLGTGIVWPGPSPLHAAVPLDFDASVMPPSLGIAVLTTSAGAARAAEEATVAAALASVASTPLLLPYTRLRCTFYDASRALNASGSGGGAAAVLSGVLAAARGGMGDALLGVIGPSDSALAIAVATLLSRAPQPLVQLSPRATSPSLGDAVAFPYFVRDVPSDVLQGRALIAAVSHYLPRLIENGLMDPSRRTVAVLAGDDAYSAGLAASVTAAAVGTLVGVGLEVVLAWGAYNALASPAARLAWLHAALLPVCASQEHTLVALFPQYLTGAVVAAGASLPCNLSSSRYQWFGGDALLGAATAGVLAVAAGICVAPSAAAGNSALGANVTRVGGGSPFAPFLYDAVLAFAHAADAAARVTRSPAAGAITGQPAALMGYMRALTTDSTFASGFGGFVPGANDPVVYAFGLYNVWSGGQLQRVGSYTSSGAVVPNGAVVRFAAGTAYVDSVPPALYLGLLVDVNDTTHERAIAGATLALRDVAASALLRNASGAPLVALRAALFDSRGSDPAAIAAALTRFSARNASLGVVGGQYSSETAAMLRTSTPLHLPLVATSATAVALGQPPGNAYFQRVVQPDTAQAAALVDLCRRLGWRTLFPVYDAADPYGVGLLGALRGLVADAGITLCPALTTAAAVAAPAAFAVAVQGCHALIIVLLSNFDAAVATFAAGAAAGLAGAGAAGGAAAGGHVWVGVDGWIASGWNASTVGALGVSPGGGASSALLPGVLSVLGAPLRGGGGSGGVVDLAASDASALAGVDAWRAGANLSALGADWGDGAAYDAVWVYAHALAAMLADGQPLNRPQAMPYINRVAFDGVRGPIQFLVADDGGHVSISDGPVNGMYDTLNIASARGAAAAVVGNTTGRGFVTFTGCAPGKTRARDGTCAPCGVDSYKPAVGDLPCTPCPEFGQLSMTTNGSTGAAAAGQCLCPAGVYFNPSAGFTPGQWACLPCPRGAVCPSINTSLAGMLNAPGYWRGSPASPVFDACFLPERCAIVGVTAPVPGGGGYSTPCPAGYTGPLCAACTSGYGRDITHSCAPCSPVGVTVAIAAAGAVFSVAVVAFLVISRGAHDAARMSRKRAANVLKAAIHYAQLSFLLANLRVGWEGPMRSFFQAEETASTSGLAVFDWDCLAGPERAEAAAFIAYMSLPLLFVALAPLAFPLAHCARARCKCAARADARAVGDTLVSSFVTLLYCMYPALVYRALTMLDCYTLGSTGGRVLRADVRVSCDAGAYSPYRTAASVALLVYAAGIPATLACGMFALRDALRVRSSGAAHVLLAPDDVALIDARVRDWMGGGGPPPASSKGGGRGARAALKSAAAGDKESLVASRGAGGVLEPAEAFKRRVRARASVFAARKAFDAVYILFIGRRAPRGLEQARDYARRSELLQACWDETVDRIQRNDIDHTTAVGHTLSHIARVMRLQRWFGILYTDYRPAAWYFECLNMCIKGLMAVIAISLTVLFDSWNIQVGAGAAFMLIVVSLSVAVEPYVNVSVLTEHRMYKPRRARIIEKLKLLARTHFDLQDPTVKWPAAVDVRRLVWYRRVPEVLSAGVLAKLSLCVVLMTLCLSLLTDNLSDPAAGRTGPRAQVAVLVLNLLLVALFACGFLCDLIAEATLYSTTLSGMCHCRCRCRRRRRVPAQQQPAQQQPAQQQAHAPPAVSVADAVKDWEPSGARAVVLAADAVAIPAAGPGRGSVSGGAAGGSPARPMRSRQSVELSSMGHGRAGTGSVAYETMNPVALVTAFGADAK